MTIAAFPFRPLAAAALLAASCLSPAAAETAEAETAEAQTAERTAAAQTTGGAGRLVYDAAFFATYSPANALQIVQRTPGFTLDTGNQDVRGFGQAAGNVVINGQRPSSKSDTLETILARIPANRVLRVEVGSGDLFGAEFSGRSQVLNLVLTATAGLAGTVEGTARHDFTGHVFPAGSASALLKRGRSTFNLSATVTNPATTDEGTDLIQALPSRTVVERRRKTNRYRDPNASLAGSWDYDGGTNRTAHLNGRYAIDRFALTQHNDVFPVGGATRDDLLTQTADIDAYEIGGDVTRPFAGGGLKLIGLATRRHRVADDLSLNRLPGGAVLGGFAQTLDDRRDETVLRLVWTRAKLLGWNVETGAEGALNRLDSDVDLFAIGPAAGRTRIDLPVDQAVVKEYRGEGFVNAGRALTGRLRLDLGLTYEASRLTVGGDASARRTLTFWKPKATIDWRTKAGWHAQLTVQRTVAQLQFEDFISTAELSNDRVNGGNADLVPQRAWEALATVEHPVLGDGLFRVEAGYEGISLVQDRIPTPEGFDAPGNLGSGRTVSLKSKLDLPLARAGIKGGRLTLYGSYVATSVEDPYTLRRRPFSGTSAFYFEGGFRQDLGRFAYGVNLSGNTSPTYYRRDELDRPGNVIPYVSVFAEYRPSRATTFSAGIDNATSATGFRRRIFFAPDRRTPDPHLTEYRERNRHLLPYLTFKHSFG